MRASSKQAGFTMIELMIVLVIMAILLAMAVPSFQHSIRNARVDSVANSLRTGFATARATAIQRGSNNIKLCASADPAVNPVCGLGVAQQGGWIVFVDANGNDVVDAGEEIIKVGAPDTVVLSAPAAPNVRIGAPSPTYTVTFDSRGTAPVGSGVLVIDATNPCTTGDKQLTLTLNAVGRTEIVAQTCP